MASLFERSVARLDDASKHSDAHPETILRLRTPRQTVEVTIPVRMDDGSLKTFTGYRCRYDDTRGPAKGGIRFHPDVNVEEVKTLAFWMTLKCATVGIPYGGGKGGVIVDPRSLSLMELERLSRGYIRQLAGVLGPETDVPAPDVYTNARVMAWMMDEYSVIAGRRSPGVITGKPVALGGSVGRDDATARGGFYLCRELQRQEDWTPSDVRIAIQGFGNAGQHMARLLSDEGYRVVAVSDSKGGVHDPDGLDVDAVRREKEESGRVGASGAKAVDNDELLGLDCEILVPAALEDSITESNAGDVRATTIVELANGPVTSDADRILVEKGVTVLPDILANAGGVTVSYFEWTQNMSGYAWDLETVHERLEAIMRRELASVQDLRKDAGTDMRTATYAHALNRLGEAHESMGTEADFRG